MVMLLLDLRTPSPIAIERAISVAAARNATLEVIAVLSDGWRDWEGRATLLGRFALAVKCIAAGRVRNVEVKRGTIQSAAISAGRERKPDLVVFAASPDSGPAATAIAEALGVPVLVARTPNDGGIIASTNLNDLRYPVLKGATEISADLGGAVTYFHNVSQMPISIDPMLAGMAAVDVAALAEESAASRQARLRTLAHQAGANAVMYRSSITSDAIVEVARRGEADLVIVGYRRRSWISRLFRGRLVEDVIARCRRSVLVLPITA